eukprot:4253594-Pyramimonas_sp.AAC.1
MQPPAAWVNTLAAGASRIGASVPTSHAQHTSGAIACVRREGIPRNERSSGSGCLRRQVRDNLYSSITAVSPCRWDERSSGSG